MVVSFVETMAGSVCDADGRQRKIDFRIKAESSSTRGLLSTGQTKVSGVIHAAPWASETVASGTLDMSAIQRRIAYHLEFVSHDGEPLVLEGLKSVRLTSALFTMTHMPVKVRRKTGAILAEGEMLFELGDLVPFAASWLPFRREAQALLDVQRRAVERRALAGT